MATTTSKKKSSSTGGRSAGRGRGMSIGGFALTPIRIAAVLLTIVGLVFIFENTAHTKIRLLVPEVTMPLWLALLGMGLIGGLIGVLAAGGRRK
jgi:uncharacterized integral membrane protein